MTVRTPVFQPLPCYGLEYSSIDVKCLACPHMAGCKQYITNVDGVPLGKVSFDLMPESVRIQRSVQTRSTVAGIYAQTYRKVFGLDSTPDRPHPDVCQTIARGAKSKSCSVELFCLIPMVARKMMGEPFFARMLTGDFSNRTFDEYHEAFIKTEHTVDLEAIQHVTGVLVHERDFTRRFVQAESTFGKSIISFFEKGIQRKSVIYPEAVKGVDPIWEALNTPGGEKLSRDARDFRVTFKKKPSVAAQAFLAWQAAMPIATREVFSERGHDCNNFISSQKVFDNTFKFWSLCGYVFQQFAAIDLANAVLG